MRHMVIQHEHKSQPQCCETCGKFFPTKSKLTDHIFVHTGDKPIKCGICSKSMQGNAVLLDTSFYIPVLNLLFVKFVVNRVRRKAILLSICVYTPNINPIDLKLEEIILKGNFVLLNAYTHCACT